MCVEIEKDHRPRRTSKTSSPAREPLGPCRPCHRHPYPSPLAATPTKGRQTSGRVVWWCPPRKVGPCRRAVVGVRKSQRRRFLEGGVHGGRAAGGGREGRFS